jgi:uncharacterized heparinase superfamily protein
VALLGFGWLRHLRAADTALTRANARSLVDDWITNAARHRAAGRRADVLARRVISLLSQAPLVLGDTDSKFYRRYLRGLTREIRYLRYTMLDIPDGVPRLQVLIALCYASLCLANQARHIRAASRKLSEELQRQILPDGGHISRNPGALIELLIDLLPLRQTFAARNIAPPPALLNAIDRMMPMLRFFRHGDGSFALFNGMSSAPSDQLATLLAYDDAHGAPMANMPHSGFQRLDAGALTVIMDTGPPPPPNVSQEAHAGCLSFELSSGASRIVINCGMPSTGRDNWRAFARSTAAHSTLTYHETSSCQFVELSAVKRLLQGAPIVSGPTHVESYRETVAEGELLTTSHDGYLERFGVVHRRVLMVAQDGSRLDGEDTVSPAPGARPRSRETDYALRFHLHPAVKASRLGDARGVMLVLPNRDVWTFEAVDDKVELEESVFLAGNDGDGPERSLEFCALDGFALGNGGQAQRAPRTGIAAGVSSLPQKGIPTPQSALVSWPPKPCYAAGLIHGILAYDRSSAPRDPRFAVRFRQVRTDRICPRAGRPRHCAGLHRRHRQGDRRRRSEGQRRS